MNVLEVENWIEKKAGNRLELRNYQLEAWSKLWTARAKANRKRALIHLATGLGKTSVAAVDVLHFLLEENPAGRVLFVSHMNDISAQAQRTFLYINPDFTSTIFRGKLENVNLTFSTFQGLYNQLENIDPEYFSYIVYDEAHHIEAETFSAVRKHFKPKFELGLTATPERADGRDIFNYFGHPLFSKSLAESISEGWLSEVDYHIVFDDAIKKAMSKKFEFKTLKEIRSLFAIRTRNETISKEVLQRRHAIGLDKAKTIVFCQNIEAGDAMAKLLGGEVYHSERSDDDRLDILKRFKSGKLQVICTVDMFNEGIDIPDARLVVFLRSTSSRTIFEQQLGRGLRRAPGKDTVTVLDFVANVERINFVRDLGHTISKLRGGSGDYSGFNTGRNAESSTATTENSKYFELTHFTFEDQTIEILERYETLKGIEHLTRDQVVSDYNELGNVGKVAEKYGVSWNAIYKHLKKAGIDTSGHLTKIPTQEMIDKFYELGSTRKVASYFNINISTVQDRLRSAGVPMTPRSEERYSFEEIIQAYIKCDYNMRATGRYLKQDRSIIAKRLARNGIVLPKKPVKSDVTEEIIAKLYQQYNGDITQIVSNTENGKWTDVYKALDRYGYLDKRHGPITSAQAAAAWYKFGSSTKAGSLLGVSPTYISRLSKDAKYIPKYGKGRKNKAKVASNA